MIREQFLTQPQAKGANLAQSALVQSLAVLLIGVLFGVVLTKAEVISWFRIQQMFRFEAAHVYLVMTSAIVVAALSLLLLKRFQLKSLQGEAIKIKEKPYQKGVIFGGLLFGMGWAITGACPGPIYAQLGSGEALALITFAGAFAGSYLYAYVRPYLPH
jgi:uncharacterized membrane protein YedE/YeeE